ncbi:MAG: carboxypeptidase-like regulatory domain-containing protein [Cyclobacteriaceae bacterium]
MYSNNLESNLQLFGLKWAGIVIFVVVGFGTFDAAGQTGTIKGKVVDCETKTPLAFAHVFINNTSNGITTNSSGLFQLDDVVSGSVEIVTSFVGYETARLQLRVTDQKTVEVEISLQPQPEELSTVEVKASRDLVWERQLKKFEKALFGARFARYCSIKNPWVLEFKDGNQENAFTATASQPLEITNYFLGYSVRYYLRQFKITNQSYLIEGNAFFQSLPNNSDSTKWAANRIEMFYGSDRHFFHSILANQLEQSGFQTFMEKKDAVDINTRSELFYENVGIKLVAFDPATSIAATTRAYEYSIKLPKRLEIHYHGKTGVTRFYKDITGSVSWLEVQRGEVVINQNGIVLNPGEMIFSGEMAENRLGSMLPLDYLPIPSKRVAFGLSQKNQHENVYLHTDKPYYYPGETIWAKAYLTSEDSEFPPSSVLYVEWIDSTRTVLKSYQIPLNQGMASIGLPLPEATAPGKYALRSYTQWMRNFDENIFFQKPIPVLQLRQRLRGPDVELANDSTLIIRAQKATYKMREKIELQIEVQDRSGLATEGHLSVSVTDVRQVSTILNEPTITGIIKKPFSQPLHFSFDRQYGLSLMGRLTTLKGKPIKGSLNVIAGKFQDFFVVETDDYGRFDLKNLHFFDSLTFAFTSNGKREIGQLELIRGNNPAIRVLPEYINLNFESNQTLQRYLPLNLPDSARQLNEVTVKGSRPAEPISEVQHKFYGKPDHTINGSALTNSSTTDLVVALQGKVPGLIITQVADKRGGLHYRLRIRGESSILLNKEPLVIIDGVPVGGATQALMDLEEFGDTAGDRLKGIDVNQVDRVEVTTRVNTLYGEAGRNGVIAVYTKAGKQNGFTSQATGARALTVMGYHRSPSFSAPDYSQSIAQNEAPDFRSTIYWNAEIVLNATGKTTLSFWSADLPGRYRVVCEGLLTDGTPVRSVTYIEVVAD